MKDAIDTTISCLRHNDFVGKLLKGHQGLGYGSDDFQRWESDSNKDRQALVVKEKRQIEEETGMTKSVLTKKPSFARDV